MMIAQESKKSLRAGQAFLNSIKDDAASQAALLTAQAEMLAFGIAVREVMGPVNTAQSAAESVMASTMGELQNMQDVIYRGVASGNFNELRELAKSDPETLKSADELEELVAKLHRAREENVREISEQFQHIGESLPDLLPSCPAFDDPELFSSIVPIGEQLRSIAKDMIDELREAKRRKAGEEKWRRAKKKMLDRLREGKLPKSLRDSAKAIDETYNTTRSAALHSDSLKTFFKLGDAGNHDLVDELAEQSEKRMKLFLAGMSPAQRAEAEVRLRQMKPKQRLEMMKILAENPDAGRVGDVTLIDDTDVDCRADLYRPT